MKNLIHLKVMLWFQEIIIKLWIINLKIICIKHLIKFRKRSHKIKYSLIMNGNNENIY